MVAVATIFDLKVSMINDAVTIFSVWVTHESRADSPTKRNFCYKIKTFSQILYWIGIVILYYITLCSQVHHMF